jgi:hypothetical protein
LFESYVARCLLLLEFTKDVSQGKDFREFGRHTHQKFKTLLTSKKWFGNSACFKMRHKCLLQSDVVFLSTGPGPSLQSASLFSLLLLSKLRSSLFTCLLYLNFHRINCRHYMAMKSSNSEYKRTIFSTFIRRRIYEITVLKRIQNLKIRIYRTVILPVVLYGCETWSLTLKEERRLRVFGNSVLKRIFGPKRDEVKGE